MEKSSSNTLTPAQFAAWDYAHTHAVKDKDGRENFHAIYEAFLAGTKCLTWQDVRTIVCIADALLDNPRMRHAVQNHSEQDYYERVLKEYRKEATQKKAP